MAIHIRTWPGSGQITLTDMTNAGKRGKTCRRLRVSGVSWGQWAYPLLRDDYEDALRCMEKLAANMRPGFHPAGDFDVARSAVRAELAALAALGSPTTLVELHDTTVRGVDAPREPLTAGVEGKWAATATEEGVALRDLNDANEWTEITPSSQAPSRAYDLARKVWARVAAAPTRYEASKVLTAAGCKLHGFCGRD